MTETETAERTEIWTYVGQRVSSTWKPMHCWLDPTGETHWFAKVKGDGIGARYEVTITGDSVYSSGDRGPRYVDQLDDRDQRAQWAADERSALIVLEQHRRAKRDATNELGALCAPLRDQMRKTIGHARRAALLAAIMEEVTS